MVLSYQFGILVSAVCYCRKLLLHKVLLMHSKIHASKNFLKHNGLTIFKGWYNISSICGTIYLPFERDLLSGPNMYPRLVSVNKCVLALGRGV